MMKKEYITPAIEIIEMEMISMIAGSVEDGEGFGGNPDEDFGDEGSELSNRRRNYWKEMNRGW